MAINTTVAARLLSITSQSDCKGTYFIYEKFIHASQKYHFYDILTIFYLFNSKSIIYSFHKIKRNSEYNEVKKSIISLVFSFLNSSYNTQTTKPHAPLL
jgi:hypothetical protein